MSIVKAPSVHDQGLAPREKKQTETKKKKTSTTNQTSIIRKKPKTPKARTKKIKHSPHDQDDVRNKEPEDWDQVMKIQQVLEAVVRSFGAATAGRLHIYKQAVHKTAINVNYRKIFFVFYNLNNLKDYIELMHGHNHLQKPHHGAPTTTKEQSCNKLRTIIGGWTESQGNHRSLLAWGLARSDQNTIDVTLWVTNPDTGSLRKLDVTQLL